MIDMKKFMLACMALLAVTACEDEIDKQRDKHAGEVHATASEIYSVEVTSAIFDATVYGDGVTERGVCWGESEFPTLEDYSVADTESGAGSFTAVMDNLKANTTYHARAYAIRDMHTYYSSSLSFTTYPEVTATLSEPTASLDYLIASINVAGGSQDWLIDECGIVCSTTPNPTLEGGRKVSVRNPDRGDFNVTVSGLSEGTTYYLRAYAVYDLGTVYSEQRSVKTLTSAELRALFEGQLAKNNLNWGVVRKDNRFAMHYSLDMTAETITVTYVESTGSKDAKHVTRPVAFNSDYSELTWETVSNDGADFSGIMLNTNLSLSVIGTAGLALDAPMSATDIYSMYVGSNYGGIGRVSELHTGNYHPSVPASLFDLANILEYNGGSGGFITCPKWQAYLLFKNTTDASGKPVIPIAEDVATFSFGELSYPYGGSFTSDEEQEIKTGMKPLTDILYDTDGVIVIKDLKDGRTPTQGDFYVWMISKNGEKWLKWYLREYGK